MYAASPQTLARGIANVPQLLEGYSGAEGAKRTYMRNAVALTVVLTAILAGCAAEESGGERPEWAGTEPPKAPAASSPAPTTPAPAAPTPVTVDTPETKPTQDSSKGQDETEETPAPPKVTPPNTCQTAHDLGGIAGDDGDSTLSVQGSCTEWFRLRVQEKKTSVFSNPMAARLTLVSPSGKDFDLFVYMNTETDAVECTTQTTKSEEPGSRTDMASLSWGEAYTANSSDDSRTVNVLVKSKDGSCDANKTWSLVIQGNK